MTLFFNLTVFESISQKDPKKALSLLKRIYNNKIAYSAHDAKILLKLRKGTAFILKPHKLFTATKNLDVLYSIQYVRLAGRRDYFLAKQGVTWLALEYYPDLNISTLTKNPLLKINKNQLIFKFEQD